MPLGDRFDRLERLVNDLTGWAYDMQLRGLSQEERETFPELVRDYRQRQAERRAAARRIAFLIALTNVIAVMLGSIPAVIIALHH